MLCEAKKPSSLSRGPDQNTQRRGMAPRRTLPFLSQYDIINSFGKAVVGMSDVFWQQPISVPGASFVYNWSAGNGMIAFIDPQCGSGRSIVSTATHRLAEVKDAKAL